MKLTKEQRKKLHGMFGGRCAYCGCDLGDRWHADHVEAVRRELKYRVVNDGGVQRGRFVPTGGLERPENDCIENMMPSCPPCNIDKHAMPLEEWRKKLQMSCGVMNRNSSTYRHAHRFGLLVETGAKVVFYFEKWAAAPEAPKS